MSSHSSSGDHFAGRRPVISATEPDWERERPRRRWDPPRMLLRSIRRYQYWASRGGVVGALLRRRWVLSHRFWSAICGADIPVNCRLGGGLQMPHPHGIVIHPDAEVGPNCILFQQVTLGAGGKKPGVPKLVGRVDVGAGAKILGGVTLGANCQVGANAVVLDDVPDGAVAVGVPARIVSTDSQPTSERRGSSETSD